MSALHRRLLKRAHGEPDGRDELTRFLATNRSEQASAASDTVVASSTSSPGASGRAPAVPLSDDSVQPAVSTDRVGPEPCRQEAERSSTPLDEDVCATDVRAAAHSRQRPATPQPLAETELAENLQKRLRAIFLKGPGAPRRSEMKPVADDSYLWLLVAVKKAAASFWMAHEEEARRCCEPSLLAEMEVRGYLANDALGNPLLPPLPPGSHPCCPDAVGKRVFNGVTKADKEEKAAQKMAREGARQAARKAGVAVDAAAVDQAVEAAVKVALATRYDLQLQGVVRLQKQKTAAIMTPCELAMAGGEVQLTQLQADLHRAEHKAEAAVRRAEGQRLLKDAAGDEMDDRGKKYAALPDDSSEATLRSARTKFDTAHANFEACCADSYSACDEAHTARVAASEAVLRLAKAAQRWDVGIELVPGKLHAYTGEHSLSLRLDKTWAGEYVTERAAGFYSSGLASSEVSEAQQEDSPTPES